MCSFNNDSYVSVIYLYTASSVPMVVVAGSLPPPSNYPYEQEECDI